MHIDQCYEAAVALLKSLIATPSFSKEEGATASLLEAWLQQHGIPAQRKGNNVYAYSTSSTEKKTLLLLSHHDTVRPAPGYTRDPFAPVVEDGRLYGLGSNDAGGSLVALAAAFLYFQRHPGAGYNLVFAATAEEELSGAGGVGMLLPELEADCAIVGEPTLLRMTVAERGLLVLDIVTQGTAGHAARNEGENALYKAMEAIHKLRALRFEKVSELLGPTTLNVTSIRTENKAHNVVPDRCAFVADVRINELYSPEEVLGIIEGAVDAAVTPRSLRLRSTVIGLDHELVQKGFSYGLVHYGSPTLSDKALLPFPALKIGPGDSARSHSADEFIYLQEIREGIQTYINLIKA